MKSDERESLYIISQQYHVNYIVENFSVSQEIERNKSKLSATTILEMQRIDYMKYTYAQTD